MLIHADHDLTKALTLLAHRTAHGYDAARASTAPQPPRACMLLLLVSIGVFL